MTIASPTWRRALVLVAAVVGTLIVANPAQAQDPGTGAQAQKLCPASLATLGQTVTCVFSVRNTGTLPAEVISLTETFPFPGGTSITISCTVAGGEVITVGSTLAPDTPCLGSFQFTIPNDRALCNTFVADRVSIDLRYTGFPGPPRFAFAGATGATGVVCPAEITITKSADELSKVGDPVNYTFEICNVGDAPVNRGSVTDTLLGDLTAFFPATLAPDACATVVRTRTVAAGDPDPLVNTVTAVYNAGSGDFATSDTATATDSTELFQPSVEVTKNCTPDPVEVGGVVTCTIVVTDTSSDDAPPLVNGTIEDSLTGNLLAAGNTAVVSSTCTASLPDPVGPPQGTCTIVTQRTVLASDPSQLCNTVTVNYNPTGFPNNITDEATDCVVVKPPRGGEGCTPGFWKQEHHFDSWVGFAPTDSFEAVFGVSVPGSPTLLDALNSGGGGINALMRHAVAALLNASNPDVDSDFTVAEVIALVQEAIETGDIERIKDILAAANEQGCPLN
jgi:uncharacterized repeat protein (TIGR01451 family)